MRGREITVVGFDFKGENIMQDNLLDNAGVVERPFQLPFAALMLTAGTLGDRFGRKRLFLAGLVLFLLGSLLCGFAPLLVGRAVQGIGAAGPLVGGVLIQLSSWPAIFFVNLPVGIVALALGWPLLSESRNPKAKRIDLSGQVLVTGALTCLIMALIESSSQGWTSALILGLFSGAAVCLAAFLLVEARVREPMLPLGLFRNRIFSVANVAGLLLGFAMLGTFFFITQFLQSAQGYTPLEAGLWTLPTTAGMFVIAPLAGLLTARLGARLPIVLGGLLAALALFLLLSIEPDTSYATLWWKFGLYGIGLGLMLSPLTAAVLSGTPQELAGLGSSVNNTSRQVGFSLGVAVLGTFVVQQFTSNIASQLTQAGVPASLGATIASKIASAGAQACQAQLSGRLPLPAAALHQAINQAFVDALHGSYLIAGTAPLAAALLVAFLLQQKQRATSASGEPTGSQVTTITSAMQPVGAAGDGCQKGEPL
jgi:EmrB/QacA subfamily drug resistance transporter